MPECVDILLGQYYVRENLYHFAIGESYSTEKDVEEDKKKIFEMDEMTN